jgi:hypothetical protein
VGAFKTAQPNASNPTVATYGEQTRKQKKLTLVYKSVAKQAQT